MLVKKALLDCKFHLRFECFSTFSLRFINQYIALIWNSIVPLKCFTLKRLEKRFYLEMVFCYQNCSYLLWEKKCSSDQGLYKFELKAKNLQNSWDHWNNLFKQWKVRTIFGNRMFFWLVPVNVRKLFLPLGKFFFMFPS